MYKRINFLGVLLAALCLGHHYSQAQAITAEDVVESWDRVTAMVIESAKLMPAEHYSFTPGAPLRNFANQLNHTTASNIGFGYAVNAGQPGFNVPSRSNPPQEKEAVIDIMEKSFAYFRQGLSSLTTTQLAESVPWGPRNNQRQISRLKAILIVTSHLQREHGKTMMYLRAKGIKPVQAGSW